MSRPDGVSNVADGATEERLEALAQCSRLETLNFAACIMPPRLEQGLVQLVSKKDPVPYFPMDSIVPQEHVDHWCPRLVAICAMVVI